MKRIAFAFVVVVAAGCATAPKPQTLPQNMHGVASWYGQEFAGRTTANGEIFDPLLFTAAHRTLPFGTGGRMIDLSYAAAQQIGLIEPGSGDVEVIVVKLGNGEREAPAPYVVTVPDVKSIGEAPASIPVVVDSVQVVEEHQAVETRLQVSADGRMLQEVPIQAMTAEALDAQRVRGGQRPSAVRTAGAAVLHFFVQVGAFAQESNAKELLSQLAHIGQTAHIDSGPLYKVRIGPFDTRDQAIQARARLESAGLSAIVVAQ